jgi:flagellar biosynthesis/type III secretory pathway protein FliH
VDADFGQVDGRLTTRLAEVRRAVDQAGEGVA